MGFVEIFDCLRREFQVGFAGLERTQIVDREAAPRDVIDAKYASFRKRPEAERLPDMSPEALYRTIKKVETLSSDVTSAESRAVFTPLIQTDQ